MLAVPRLSAELWLPHLPWTTPVSLSRNWGVDSRLRMQNVSHSTSHRRPAMHLHPNSLFFTGSQVFYHL
jgi:hypothetical protein